MNALKPSTKTTIITLLQNGISDREINRKTGVDRKTIRKYARELGLRADDSNSPTPATGSETVTGESPPPRPPDGGASRDGCRIPKEAHSACEPFREWIVGEVDKGRNAVSIYQDMVERYAFSHRYNSVKRFVRCLKRREPERFDRLDFLPGEESQVDYGTGAPTLHPVTGKYRSPRLFVMTLRYSRRSFRKVVWNSSQQTWAKLHEEAFRYFGGCPQYVVLDNLKEGVISPDIYEPELNVVYGAMLAHYGVVADPARVRDPNRKGTVENAIGHTQGTALKGRRFETIEEQNEWLMHWEERWAAPRIHGRTKRQVQAMFIDEKPHLKTLPMLGFRYFKQEMRTVQDDGLVQIGNAYYAALPLPLHSGAVVRIFDSEIEIIDPRTLDIVRRHAKAERPGEVKMLEEDRIKNPSRMTRQLLETAGRVGPNTKKLCEVIFDGNGRVGHRKMRGIVSLTRHYSAPLIETASKLALEKGVRSSRQVREIVDRLAKAQNTKQLMLLTEAHALIRPMAEYEEFFRQHAAEESLKN